MSRDSRPAAAAAAPPPQHRIGPEDFLYGAMLGEGAYAKVMHVRLYLPAPSAGASQVTASTSPAASGSVVGPPFRAKDYAMKIMEKNHIKKERKAAFVMMERSVMSRATHPNVVKLAFTFQDRENLFLVMDLCKGRELLKAIRDYSVRNEKLGVHHTACPEDLAHA